jgi:hypothetical protein
MIPNYGYQLSQEQRTRTRAEFLAGDVRLGRQAAVVSRGGRAVARRARASVGIALKAIAAVEARATARSA